MSVLTEILSLLREKKELLLEIEQVSNEMKNAPAEELMSLFTRRGELLERAKTLGERIDLLAEGDETLTAALKNSAEPGTLEGELFSVYDESLRIKAVANRILREEEGIKEHIQAEKDGLLEKLQGLNSSSSSVAGSYRRCVQTGMPADPLGRKTRTI